MTGSRSSQSQQSGDVVCLAVVVYVQGVLHGMDRERRVRDYLIGLYHYDDLSTEKLWLSEYDQQSEQRPSLSPRLGRLFVYAGITGRCRTRIWT